MIQIHRPCLDVIELLDKERQERKKIDARIVQELGKPPRCSMIDKSFILRTFASFVNAWYDSGKAMDRMFDRKEYDEKAGKLRYQLEYEQNKAGRNS